MPAIPALDTTTTSTATTRDAFSALTSQEFVKIMFTELSNQDPLKPNDSNQMLQQLSSLRSIQSDINLGNKLDSIVTQNQLSTAGSLIGKYISGLTDNGQRVIGQVVAVARDTDGPVLKLSNNFLVPFKNVDVLQGEIPTVP